MVRKMALMVAGSAVSFPIGAASSSKALVASAAPSSLLVSSQVFLMRNVCGIFTSIGVLCVRMRILWRRAADVLFALCSDACKGGGRN